MNECGPYTMTARRCSDVEVPEAADGIVFDIRVTIETANSHQSAFLEGAEKLLAQLVESVRIRGPIVDKSVDESESLRLCICAKRVHTRMKRRDRRNAQYRYHSGYLSRHPLRHTLRPQHVLLHLAAVEMEERHRRVVFQRPGGEAAVEFGEHVLGHGVRVGERF
jgi:hypothetical protein